MEKLDKPRFFSDAGRSRPAWAMLLLSCLLLFCTIHGVAADAQLPGKTISLELKDVSMLDALREINRVSGNQLLFRNEEVAKETGKINAEFRDTPVLDAVAEVLRGANLKHIVRGDVIVISPQDNTATGVVVDERGQPLAGVTVSVIGTSVGVATDPTGAFSVKMPEGRTRLRISYVGYVSQEVAAASNMRIVLKTEVVAIDDVVVTGMTRIDRRMFTGATDKLDGEEVKLDGIPDVSRALEGRSAGVTLQNVSSTFGTAPKIRVRGSTSILGSSKPLWVVDNVIVEDVGDISVDDLSTGDAATLLGSAVAGLSADDIEDFQILKDGSATSIYGARAMAGVIVITTKKGKAGEARVSYTGEFTSRLKPSYREYDVMNSQDQMSVYEDLANKGWLKMERVLRYQNSGIYGQMYDLINTYDPATGQFGLAHLEKEAMNAYLRMAEMRNTDWFDELFSNNVMQQHSVSISTGNHKATNYISMSVLDDPGWYKRSGVQRYTARANSNIFIFDNLQLSLNSSASYRHQEAPGTMAQTTSSGYGEISRNFDINPFSYAMNTSRTIAADEYHTRNYTTFNIHEELENNFMELNVLNASFQGQLTYNVTPELSFKALGSVNYSSNSMQWFMKDRSNAARAYRAMDDDIIAYNHFLYTDPDNPYNLPVSVLKEGGIFDKTELRMLSYDFRVDATFNKRFDSNNSIHVFGGMEINDTQRSRDWFQGWALLYDYGELATLDYLAFKRFDENNVSYFSLKNSNKRNAAFFTTATYSFRDKYTLNGTFRYEGTNRMGRAGNARWLPTWNVSGNWQISEEAFFEKVDNIFTEMKLRASYSLTADTGPSWVTNSTDLIYSTTRWTPDSKGQETGVYVSESGNANLTYEKKHELNIGLDFAVLKNRLSFQTDIYWRDNFDLIGLMNTEGLSGEIRRYANVANMKSRGFELTISSRNIVTPKFRWNSHLTFSTQKAEITSLLSNTNLFQLVRGTTLYSLQGYPTNAVFSIPFTGLDADGLPTYADPYDKTKTINQSDFSTNIFQITDEDVLKDYLKYEGPGEPTITGGLSNTFTYRNLSMNVFMTYGFGNVIRLRPVFSYRYSDITASSEVFKNRWIRPGDELTTNVPVIASARQDQEINMLRRGYSYYNYSDVRVAKGDFVRMKEISLVYTFSKEMLKQINTQRLSLKIAAVNPFLIYADKALNGQDPEFIESGGVSSPIAKQFTFTIRLGF